ncbi:MAG: serine protease [Chloroflexi bacterium]|nr:serine protease [Chloroflexota bacterium]MCY3589946.1 serine protease [Chloroflexota bacterium]MCY3684613.1 serine protease [Chloroflexota bacterium]MDE2709991.1 serine protease [Chloroflexota bacterium]
MSILTTRPAVIAAVIAAAIVTSAVLFATTGDTVTTDVQINARQLADGRVEFALEHQGQRILPRQRYFPAQAPVDRWLRSSAVPLEVEIPKEPSRVDDAMTQSGGTQTEAQPESCDITRASVAVSRSTVKVVTNQGSGTAFYVGGDEYVTAAHVVQGQAEIRLSSALVPATDAEVVGYQPGADIAILRARGLVPALSLRTTGPLAGMTIGVAGYPGGLGQEASITRGVVSRVFSEAGVSFLQTDAAASPGNSGGPLFDACGRVLGVVSAKLAGVAYEGVIFAVIDPSLSQALEVIRSGHGQRDVDPSTAATADVWLYLQDGDLRYDGSLGWLVVSALTEFDLAQDYFNRLEVLISTDGGLTHDTYQNRQAIFAGEPLQLSGLFRVRHTEVNYVRASIGQGLGEPDFQLRCGKHENSTAERSIWACLPR